MKKLFALALLSLFFLGINAQENESSIYHHQLSLNATSFISNYLTFNNNAIVSNTPFIVAYKNLTNGEGLRAGLGINFVNRRENPNNGLTSVRTNNMGLDIRIGYENQFELSRRWLFYLGIDGVYGYDLNRTVTTSVQGFPPEPKEIVSDNEAFNAGGGPVIGLEFKLSKRLSLNTETTAYLMYRESRRRITNPNFGSFNTNEFSATNSLNIIIPTSIFFVLHF
jgi:hypothetical protein